MTIQFNSREDIRRMLGTGGASWCPRCKGSGMIVAQDPGIPHFLLSYPCDCVNRYREFGEDLFDDDDDPEAF